MGLYRCGGGNGISTMELVSTKASSYTAESSGLYLVTLSRFSSSTTAGLSIVTNGEILATETVRSSAASSDYYTHTTTYLVKVAAGQSITISSYQSARAYGIYKLA